MSTSKNIFGTLYNDYIKPLDKYILTVIIAIIFVVAGYLGYNWFVRPTIENHESADLANDNRRISDSEILFFSADWCPHCKTAKPEWNNFKSSFNEKNIGFYKLTCIDVDCTEGENPLIQEYSVDGYPTIILKKDGKRIDYDARITEENLKQFINEFLDNN
jgi:thiol-disulfide isomerase/thioredoxin